VTNIGDIDDDSDDCCDHRNAAKTITVNDLCYGDDDNDVEYLSRLDIQWIYKLKRPLLLPTNSHPTLII
jgi:hypothetical protein